MTDTNLDGWTDDGHTVTLTLDVERVEAVQAHIHCPFEGIDVADIAIGGERWRALPGCRREHDEFGTPIGPSKECLIRQWQHEFSASELFERSATSYVIVSPFRVAWQWLAPDNGPILRPVGLAVHEEPSR